MKMKAFVVFELMILVHVSQHASGVEVYEGAESVLLPCHISMMPEDPVVVWSRLDLNPTTVHQLQDKTDEPYVQNQRFSKRTSMSAVALDTGDLSLTLNKPRLRDSGNYTCSVHSGKFPVRRTDVELQVKEPYTFPAEAWVLLVLLAVVVASVLAVFLYYKVITVSQVEVEEMAESVELPYKTILKLPEDATVTWSRCEPKPMKVHVYKKDQDHLAKQDQFYHGRTEMKKKPLKTGELSLTLNDPCIRDSGTYMCTVHKYRHIWAQKVVQLRFKGTQVEVEEWQTFTLPFKTSIQLPENATVEWIRSKPKTMIVHVYQDGRDQPDKQDDYYYGRTEMDNSPLQSRDLSVKVYNSGFSDRGTYICRVLVNGDVLVQKEVLLHIKVSKVKVDSTTLRCYITADLPENATVEWTRCEPKSAVVHVYENGQEQPERQDGFFQQRTEMKIDLLKTRNLSLTLRHLDDRDSGVYMCTVRRGEDIVARRVVPFRAKVHQQEVEVGTVSVQLPFQSSVQLPEDATVEWSRCKPEPRVVHIYKKSQDQSERQDQFYRGRTKMKKKPLQSGDLSLTLRHPTHKDSDYYICTVSRGGDFVRQKVVRLQVKEGGGWSTKRSKDEDEVDDARGILLTDVSTEPV